MKTLDAVSLDTVSVRDTRGGVRSKGALFTVRCQILMSQHKLEQAEAACHTAIERGATIIAPYYLALMLYLQGRDEEALHHIELSLAGLSDNPPARFLHVLLLRSLERPQREVVAASMGADHELIDDMVRNGKRSREAWGKTFEQQEEKHLAEELALCGHYYLDLQMPERAEACFSRAEAIRPETVTIERLIHQAESDPPAAIRAAQALLDQERNPIRLYAMAFAQQRAGNPGEALSLLDESLGQGLRPSIASHLLTRVCQDLNQKDCLGQRRLDRYNATHPQH